MDTAHITRDNFYTFTQWPAEQIKTEIAGNKEWETKFFVCFLFPSYFDTHTCCISDKFQAFGHGFDAEFSLWLQNWISGLNFLFFDHSICNFQASTMVLHIVLDADKTQRRWWLTFDGAFFFHKNNKWIIHSHMSQLWPILCFHFNNLFIHLSKKKFHVFSLWKQADNAWANKCNQIQCCKSATAFWKVSLNGLCHKRHCPWRWRCILHV